MRFDDLSQDGSHGYVTLLEVVESNGLNALYLGIVGANWQVEANDVNGTEGSSCAEGVAVCTPHAVVEDTNYHVVLTLDGDDHALYVDGVEVSSGTLPGTPGFATAQWVIGADTDNGSSFTSDSFPGSMDEVRL